MEDRLDPIRGRLAQVTAGWAAGRTLAEIRTGFADFLAEVGPRGMELAEMRRVSGLGFEAAWIGRGERRMLYCHGGGFQIGGVASHKSLMARLGNTARATVLGFDYRLAPEHRFPAAPDDALAAYRFLLQQGGPPDAVVGDSAGGALALLTVQRARDLGLALPKAIVLISPWLDLSMQGESYEGLASQDIFSRPAQLRAMARSYLGRDIDPRSPAASPLWGGMQGLPRILVHAGSLDITLDDSRMLEQRVRAAGGDISLKVFDGMCHHFQIFEALPEANVSIAEICGVLRLL